MIGISAKTGANQHWQNRNQKTIKNKTYTEHVLASLHQLMQDEALYQQSNLRVKDIAQKLGISASELSTVINRQTGNSFWGFVNQYRLEEAKRILSGEKHLKNITVLDIAYEVGFNSKSSFYRAFKQHTNMTPLQFQSI